MLNKKELTVQRKKKRSPRKIHPFTPRSGLSEKLDKKFKISFCKNLTPVVQKLDSAIYGINRYPVDKYYEN